MWQRKHISQETPSQKELFTDLFPETPPEKPETQAGQKPANNLTEIADRNGYYYKGRYVRLPYADN
jgi:hypothetical protein